jgi:hypothetical protein
VLGRGRSLLVATVLGFVGIVALVGAAVYMRSIWTVAISVFLLLNCWSGLQSARKLLQFAKLPRRDGFRCPSCRTAPPIGTYWRCGNCQQMFDTFETRGLCPHCSAQYATTTCLDCREQRPIGDWAVNPHPMGVVSGTFETK